MGPRTTVLGIAIFLLGAIAALAGAVTFPQWLAEVRTFLNLESGEAKDKADDKKPAEPEDEHVHLSGAARKSLGIIVEPLAVQPEFPRSLTLPGVVVERPGNCEQLVTAPLAGVVKQIYATPHDRVAPGKPLFTLQLISEPLQIAQTGYYKTKRELEQVKDWQRRLNDPTLSIAIPPATMIEREQQAQRLATSLEGYEQELKMWGLTLDQIEKAGLGNFLRDITVLAPAPVPDHAMAHGSATEPGGQHAHASPFVFEMEELKTLVGDSVQAGQVLCRLADHKTLFIEGRVFAKDVAQVQKAAIEGLKVRAEIAGDKPQFVEGLQLAFFANKVEQETQSLTFFVVLPNRFDELKQSDKTYHLWQYRPGQKVKLHVPSAKMEKVFVVPAAAVVREGPQVFVFRANGPEFERYPVQLLHEDNRHAVLAFDEKIAGQPIAMNSAIQLNWVLKSQRGGGGGHSHGH